MTTSLRGNTCVDVTVQGLEHPVHSGQYGGPILDSNTLAAMLIASMYDENGDLAVPGVAAEEPIGGLQRDLDETTVREDSGVVAGYEFAGTGSLASRLWTKPSVTVIGFDAHPVGGILQRDRPGDPLPSVAAHAAAQRPEEAQEALAAFLESHAPFGAKVTVERGENGMGWAMDPTAVATKDALEAMTEAFGVEPHQQGRRRLHSVHPRTAAHFPQRSGAGHRPRRPEGQRPQPQ